MSMQHSLFFVSIERELKNNKLKQLNLHFIAQTTIELVCGQYKKEINACIQQGCIQLVKSYRKDIVTKDIYFK